MITFSPLSEEHFPLLLRWLETAHVKQWWDSDVPWTLDLIREKYTPYTQGYKVQDGISKPIHPYVILVDKQPVGYCQHYNVHDFPRSCPLVGMPERLLALDFYIGEEPYLGKGLGAPILEAYLHFIGCTEYTHALVDPDLENLPARRTYLRCGFEPLDHQPNPQELWMLKKL